LYKVALSVAPASSTVRRLLRSWGGLGLTAAALACDAAVPGLAQTTLPPLSIETQKPAKAVKKAAPKKAAPATAKTDAAPQAPAETAKSPVKDYVAKSSASGTKTDTPLSETPQSISIAGAELVRDMGAQSLQESIRYMPGLVPDGFGFDSRGDYVLIRGIAAAYFLDGMRTSYGFYANTVGAEPYSLERIEVLRGPSSMLYGQSPSGGLISMISKLPQEIRHGEITFDYGSFDFKQVKFDFGGPATSDGRWLYRFVGLARDADTQVDFVENDRIFLSPSLTYRPSADTSVTLLGLWRKDHGGSVQQFLPHLGTLKPHPDHGKISMSTFIGEPTDYNDTDQQSATLLIDHKLAPGLTLHHGTRFTHTDNTYSTHYTAPLTSGLISTINSVLGPVYDPATAPFLDPAQQNIARVFLWRNTETDVLTSDTHVTGTFLTGSMAHKLTGGIDYTRFETGGASTPILVDNIVPGVQPQFNIYNPVYGQNAVYLNFGALGVPGANPFIPSSQFQSTVTDRPDETQAQTGIYIQDQIKLGQWSAILGLRKDWLSIEMGNRPDVEQSATTGRAALMYHFKSGLSPYISFSQSFASQPGNLVVDDPSCTQNCPAPRAALPLEGEQVEVGLRYQPKGWPFMISAALFNLKEKNRLVEDTASVISGFVQQGAEVRIKGFEIEAVGKVTENLKIIAAYTNSRGEYTEHFNPVEIGTPVEGLPRHTAALWGIYTFNDGPLTGLSFGAGVRHIGESKDVGTLVTGQVGEVTTPAFTLFDAMVAYETKDWRWQLTGTNLEDEFHVITCTTRGDCGVGQGRTVITSFTYKF
jgi:iron complex outermembrane receptor protein